ncbi:hypothetical protein LBMAG27_03540 [Bacteroidota bacterium]|nr:hypothetical protein LBMAG27_03540 [Bacteroidota bacterium]
MKNHISLFVLFSVCCYQNIKAQTWNAFPVQGGGLINQVVFDPVDSSIVYAASSSSGLFKSTDAGNNWKNIFSPESFISVNQYYCRDLAVNPQNHNELFVVGGSAPWSDTAKGYLFHSTDAGVSWIKMNCPVSVSATSSYSNAGHIILFNPNNAQQIFLVGQPQFNFNTNTAYYNSGGLYVSNNDGQSWTSIHDSLKTLWFTQLILNPGNNNELLFSVRDLVMNNIHSGGSGLYKYNFNSGAVTKLFNQDVKEFAVDGANPQIIITINGHLNISTDGGTTWSSDISPLYNYTDYFISAHPTEGGHWFVGAHSGNYFNILETKDYGALWRSAEYKHNPNKQLLSFNDASCSYEPEFAYYPAGLTFSQLNPKLVIMNDQHGLWKSYNADTVLCHSDVANSSSNWKWNFSNHGIQNLDGRKIVLNHGNGKLFLSSTDPGLFVSDDGGVSCSYQSLPDVYCTQVSAIAFNKNNSSIGYLGGSQNYDADGKFFKTTDGGISWQQLAYNYFDRDSNDILNVTQIAVSDFSPDTIVVGTDSRNNQSQIHISTDGGSTWQNWSQGITDTYLFPIWERRTKLFTDGSGYFFIVNDDHLYRRKASDATWIEVTNAGGTGWWFTDAKPDPVDAGKLWVSYYNSQLFYSTDHGDTWTNITTSLDCISYFDVSSTGVIAAVQCADAANNIWQKVFYSTDNGLNFTELPLTGLYGNISMLSFTGPYVISCISQNTGAFFYDLNQTGIQNADDNSSTVFLYPNPALTSDVIHISDLKQIEQLSIYDLSGRKLKEYFKPENEIAPQLQSGIYFLNIQYSNQSVRLKLVIGE